MLIKQIIEVFDLLDSPHACGEEVKAYLQSKGEDDITVKTIRDGKYATELHGKDMAREQFEAWRWSASQARREYVEKKISGEELLARVRVD